MARICARRVLFRERNRRILMPVTGVGREMADIFREVDEEVRRERAVQIWQKYQAFFIVAAVLIIAGTAAWRFYVYHTGQQAEAAGHSYEAALQLVSANKLTDAEAAFAN